MFSHTHLLMGALLALSTLTTNPGCGNICDEDTFDDLCVMDPNASAHATKTSDDSVTGTGEPDDTDGMSETGAPEDSDGTTESPTSGGEIPPDPDPMWGPMNPGPSDHCIRMLYADLQPESGLHAERGVAVTASNCPNAQGGIALQIGTKWPFTVGDPEDVIVPLAAMPAAGCAAAHGILADFPNTQHVPMNLSGLEQGEWPTYHVLLLQNWNVGQGLIIGSEGSNGEPGRLACDTNGNWHTAAGWGGSCSLLAP